MDKKSMEPAWRSAGGSIPPTSLRPMLVKYSQDGLYGVRVKEQLRRLFVDQPTQV